MVDKMEPVKLERRGLDNAERYTHPAFGSVTLTTVNGGGGTMFLSNVRHPRRVRFEVCQAIMERSYNHDKHYADKSIVHFEMSEIQFAELVSGMNKGNGTPCTLTWMRGEGYLPDIVLPSSSARFKGEVKEAFARAAAAIRGVKAEVQKTLDAAKVSKVKQEEILRHLSALEREVGSNLPFMHHQFEESLEGMVAEAKSVVEAYASNVAPAIQIAKD
jgi:hypothetical protein